jgi:predicted nucleotidyltransferase
MLPGIDWQPIAALCAGRAKILAVWAFGSARNGILRPGSDLDIAIWWAEMPSLDDLADLRAGLQAATGIEEIDLTTLNRANAWLRFEAVCGRLLFYRDLGQVAAFGSLAAREMEDERAFYARGLRMYAELHGLASTTQPNPA